MGYPVGQVEEGSFSNCLNICVRHPIQTCWFSSSTNTTDHILTPFKVTVCYIVIVCIPNEDSVTFRECLLLSLLYGKLFLAGSDEKVVCHTDD